MTAPALTPAAGFTRFSRLTKAKAYTIASEWGSYLHSSDPGACMYGFRAGDGRPVSEAHRAQCLAYLDTLQPSRCDELFDLGRLRRYLADAPLAPQPVGRPQ